MKKKENIIFIILVLLIISVGSLTLVKGEKDISYRENRTLGTFPKLTVHGYLRGDFQNYFTTAFSDQFIGGETIKAKTHSLLTFTDYKNIPEYICKNRYVNVSDTMSTFDCSEYIMFGPSKLSDEQETTILDRLKVYSTMNEKVDMYYFLLETPAMYDFEKNKPSIDILNIVKDNLKGKYKIDYLPIENFENYKEHFYKTDHHWNYKGSYEAYKKIVKMMTKDKPLEPIEEKEFDAYFYGSAARSTQIFDYKEKFKVYRFNYPKYTVYVNGVKGKYGSEEEYLKGDYDTTPLINHYGEYYGGDDGELVFDFNKPKKLNILILGSSYTNPINKLIASHFNKTYVVDLRHYTWTKGEDFNIKEYLKDNKIDKVLIISDFNFLQDHDFDIEWSK